MTGDSVQQPNGKTESNAPAKQSMVAMWRRVRTDEWYRHKFIHTVIVCWSFVGMGWTAGMTGPTFPDLRQIIQEDLSTSSFMFTTGSIGYMMGSLGGGALYDRYNKLVLLVIATFGSAVTTILTPYCTTLELMLAIRWLGAVFVGGLDTGGNADIIFVWGTEGGSYMQALHFCFSVGALLSPLGTEPFLAKKITNCVLYGPDNTTTLPDASNASDVTSSTYATKNPVSMSNMKLPTTASIVQNVSTLGNLTYGNQTETCEDIYEETHVHTAFLISGIIILTSTFGYIYLYCKLRHVHDNLTDSNVKGKASEQDTPTRPKLTLKSKIFFLILMCLLIMSYSLVEDSFVSFLMTFSLIYLKFEKSDGAYVTAVFWICFGVGRFAGIFVVNMCKQSVLLTSATLTVVATYIGFSISSYLTFSPLVWVLAGILGFAMSVMFPIIFSWSSDNIILISGKISALMFMSCSLGNTLFPLLLGYMMEYYSPMWFVYLIGISVIVHLCVHVIIRISLRVFIRRQHIPKLQTKL